MKAFLGPAPNPPMTPQLQELTAIVEHLASEMRFAIALHETWKPASSDAQLHAAMSNTFEGHTFLVVRVALRRELLLAVTRAWDTGERSLSLGRIRALLARDDVREHLLEFRSAAFPLAAARSQCRAELAERMERARSLLDTYLDAKGGGRPLLNRLSRKRSQELAHNQRAPTDSSMAETDAADVEKVYQDTITAVRYLSSLVRGEAFDFDDHAALWRQLSGKFWIRVSNIAPHSIPPNQFDVGAWAKATPNSDGTI